MEKVLLTLETVGLLAEKTKLENDCREGASDLKTTDVCASHTLIFICPAGMFEMWRFKFHEQLFVLFHQYMLTMSCVLVAKMQPPGAEEGPAERSVQRPIESSKDNLQDAVWWVITRRPSECAFLSFCWMKQTSFITVNGILSFICGPVVAVASFWTVHTINVYEQESCFLLMQAFSELPDTPDEIDAMLNEERSRAECFTGLSENVRAP